MSKLIELDINLFPKLTLEKPKINNEKLFNLNLFPSNKLPVYNKDYNSFQKYAIKMYGLEFPAELEKGFNKYNELLEKHKNKKNPEISIKREIDRILKKKKITKIDYKKIEIKFNE
jgi:hypothetical protein